MVGLAVVTSPFNPPLLPLGCETNRNLKQVRLTAVPMSQQTAPTNSRRWIIRLLKLLVLLIVLWAGHRTISRGIEEFEQNGHRLDQIEPQWLLLSAGIYLFSQLPCGLFWRRILLSMGQRVTTWRTLRAYYIGHLGKYVPGKAMVVLLRAGLIRGPGVETGPVVAAIFYETLSTMAIGSLLGTVLLFFLDPIPWKIVLIGLGMSLGTGLPTVPLVFNVLLHVLRKDRDKEAAQSSINGESKEIEPAAKLTFRKLAPGWPGLVIGWILAGLSLWACTRAMFPDAPGPAEGLVLYISAVTLSVVAGFVSMLPGGVGVREVVLLTILAPELGAAVAVGSAILLRLTWLVAELVLAAVLYFSGERLQLRKLYARRGGIAPQQNANPTE